MLGSSKGGIVWKLTSNCPSCNSKDVARIFWGEPADSEMIFKKIKEKKIVLGGCIVTDNDPEWECNSCHHRWGQRYDCDKSSDDSFDYDQGFNLDEVYDK